MLTISSFDLTNIIIGEAHGHEVFCWAVIIHLVTPVKTQNGNNVSSKDRWTEADAESQLQALSSNNNIIHIFSVTLYSFVLSKSLEPPLFGYIFPRGQTDVLGCSG